MSSSLITYLIVGSVATALSLGSVGTSVAADTWVFRGGSSDTNTIGSYPTNVGEEGYPGARHAAATWTDSIGNLWMFGGFGSGGTTVTKSALSDVWMYDVNSHKWFWKGGSKSTYEPPTYPASIGMTGTPGARYGAASWVDSNEKIWITGGIGMAADGNGALADIWQYDPLTGVWVWEGGPTTKDSGGDYSGGHNHTGNPAARYQAACGTTQAGDFLLFGGFRFYPAGPLNDLWKFSSTAKTWTWLAGSESVNQGSTFPENHDEIGYPSGRYGMAFFTDENNDFWIFGGYSGGTEFGVRNDLWKYQPSNNNFYWMNGSPTSGESSTYPANYGEVGDIGGRNKPLHWYAEGKFWINGGFGVKGSNSSTVFFNDLWAYSPIENVWRFMDGGKDDGSGTDPLPAIGNTGLPVGRMDGQTWTSTDLLFMFGGSPDLFGSTTKSDFWYHPTAVGSAVADWQLF